MNTDTRLILLDHNLFVTGKMRHILKRNSIDFTVIDIKHFVYSLENYKNDILLIPIIFFDVFIEFINNLSEEYTINIILICEDSSDIIHKGERIGNVQILDSINIYDQSETIRHKMIDYQKPGTILSPYTNQFLPHEY